MGSSSVWKGTTVERAASGNVHEGFEIPVATAPKLTVPVSWRDQDRSAVGVDWVGGYYGNGTPLAC